MNHAELVKAIRDRATAHDVWTWPTPDPPPRWMEPGWPDIIALGSRGHFIIECKSDFGRSTLKQIEVADRIRRAGLSYRLWRPEHLETGVIDELLEGIA